MTYEKARSILFKHIGDCYIKDWFYTTNFYEFVVRNGGDVCTYRVYNSGVITER